MKTGSFIVLLSAMILSACDNRTELIDTFNDSPYFLSNGDTITTLRDSVKMSRGRYEFNMQLIDPNENLVTLSLNSTSAGRFYLNGAILNKEVIDVSGQSLRLSYEALSAGSHSLTIIMKDEFDESATLDVTLTAFSNLVPVVDFDVVQPDGASNLERLIDASNSVDMDKSFGGGIIEYEYSFLGKVVTSDDETQTVFFPSDGVYNVVVRVRDNDDVWSEPVSRNVTIN